MSWDEGLPNSIRDALIAPDERIEIAVASDMTRDGQFGEEWLIVTDRRILVVSPNGGAPECTCELPLEQVAKVQAESLVGGGRLEISVNGYTMPLLTYSNSLAAKFAEIARGIEQLAHNEPLMISPNADKVRCERCGKLLPEKNGICPACIPKCAILVRIASYLKPYWGAALALAFLMLLSTLVQLLPPYLTKIIVDDVLAPRRNFRLLLLIVAALIGLRLLSAMIEGIRGWLVPWLGGKVVADIRAQLYRCLERLALSFYDKKQVGALMSRVTYDSGTVQSFLIDGLPYIATNVLMLIGILAFLFTMSWRLTLLILIPAPIIVIGSAWFWRIIHPYFHRWWHRWAQFSARLNESLSGIKVVKAFAQEDREIAMFDKRNEQLLHAGIEADRRWYIFYASLGFITSLGVYIAWLGGGAQVISGELTLGTLMAFISYLWLFYGPLQWMSQVNTWMTRAFTGAERIFEVIDTPSEPYDAPDAIPMPRIEGRIEFKDVSFGYDPAKPVLKNINLVIEPGEMIGLVGRSGAGKSTLINLICRFYDVTHGCIEIDGVDIRKIKLSDLREQIGVVLQDPFLFDGTIAENIAYGKPDATFNEIVEAARIANAHEFIVALPDGYNTRVGERGSRLSGGERQRIAIARAILHNPRILILDEATSSVDTETEKKIQEAIARLVEGRTTIAIAHRLSTLRNANRLIVLDDGEIVETGTHEELMARKGLYYRLVQMQLEMSRTIAVGG